ncbi:Zinc finger, CCHC-type domain containing [Olea europaea subsp. europaea]|uniref:Zinc finger, CCHC-type domain containing n=1 Tax=Olea europaea subsp. europaea TaxID=158383 RepID=A0A8S0QBW3_OLEEU|nr:Zinc finger, CCHC-type domain containing [Olea europaea subsp. europaea]
MVYEINSLLFMAKNDALLIMDTNDEDVDLGLALGSTSYHIRSKMNSSSGAGVNANLIGDMAFAASDPLSELVWLPHKGLSLKCADSNLADKNPFLLWNVESSNKVPSPSQIIRSWGPEDGRVISVGRSTVPQTFLNVDSKVDDKVTSASPLRSSPIPLLNANCGRCEETNDEMKGGGFTDANQEEGHVKENRESLCSPHIVEITNSIEGSIKTAEQDVVVHGNADCKFDMPITRQYAGNIIRETCSSQNGKIENIASGSEIMQLGVAIGSEPCPAKLSEALLGSTPNIQSMQELDNEVRSATGEVSMNSVKMLDLFGAPPLVKLECTAENDLYHPTAKDTHTSSKEILPSHNSLSVEKTSTNLRIQMYWEKGKEKALSDGDDNARSTNDMEDSHTSAESCNSAGLFSKGIKRSKCRELIVENKRMKKQNQGIHASTSIVNQDSSFMNWIANMVKGVQDLNKEASPSRALALSHSNDFDHPQTITLDKTHDSKSQNIGFLAMFQSLYCSNTRIPDSGFLNENYSIGESKGCTAAEETFLENRPRSCHKDSSFKQIALPNEEVNLPISRNSVGFSSEPWILSVDFACETNAEGNKTSNDLVIEREKDGISSSGSLCKHVDSTAENTSLNFPWEGKATSTMPHKSSPLASLWITRLLVKPPELENCNRSTDQVLDGSPDSVRVNPNTQVGASFPIDQESSEMKNFAANGETSVSNKSVIDLDPILPPPNTEVGAAFPIDQESSEMKTFAANSEMAASNKSINKLNPILTPPKFESSEAMATVFARRLDALRHIIPAYKTKSSACTSTMCYFCGKIGHGLLECPDVTEIERKDLIRKISLVDGVEESDCLCIRCSQLDHWANTCPLASSSGHCPSKESASFINYSSRHLMFCSGNEKHSSYLGREEENSQLAIDQKVQSFRKLPDYTPSNPTSGANELLGKRIYEVKNRIASNLENNIKDDLSLPLCKVLSSQNEAAPVEVFHAIRKLRLSRVDILRWMNSLLSQSKLNGFFLRLRLGKWTDRLDKEESRATELGGTGYYVACITGAQRENSGRSSKTSIFANVEGVKYSVESQYVSNHDFSEDEIKTWWCRIVKAGGKIPSIDELNSKLEERKFLGF